MRWALRSHSAGNDGIDGGEAAKSRVSEHRAGGGVGRADEITDIEKSPAEDVVHAGIADVRSSAQDEADKSCAACVREHLPGQSHGARHVRRRHRGARVVIVGAAGNGRVDVGARCRHAEVHPHTAGVGEGRELDVPIDRGDGDPAGNELGYQVRQTAEYVGIVVGGIACDEDQRGSRIDRLLKRGDRFWADARDRRRAGEIGDLRSIIPNRSVEDAQPGSNSVAVSLGELCVRCRTVRAGV